MGYTSKDIEKATKEVRQKTIAEVVVKTSPLLSLTYWVEKFSDDFNSKQALDYTVKRFFPDFQGPRSSK